MCVYSFCSHSCNNRSTKLKMGYPFQIDSSCSRNICNLFGCMQSERSHFKPSMVSLVSTVHCAQSERINQTIICAHIISTNRQRSSSASFFFFLNSIQYCKILTLIFCFSLRFVCCLSLPMMLSQVPFCVLAVVLLEKRPIKLYIRQNAAHFVCFVISADIKMCVFFHIAMPQILVFAVILFCSFFPFRFAPFY